MTPKEWKVNELRQRINSVNFRLRTYKDYVSSADISDGYTIAKLYCERKAYQDELNKLIRPQ